MRIPRKQLFPAIVSIVVIGGASIGFVLYWQVSRAITEVYRLNGAVSDTGDPLFGPEKVTFAIMGIEQIIDDSGFQRLLPYLKNFQRLNSLDLSGTALTPDAMKGIDELKGLTRLEVPEGSISESSISAIARLKRLKVLYVYGAKNPGPMKGRLRKELPTVDTHVDKRRWSQPLP